MPNNESMSKQCTNPTLVEQPGDGYLHLVVKAVKTEESKCGGYNNPDSGGLVESDPGDRVSGHVGFEYSYGYVEWRAYVTGDEPKGWECPKGGCIPDWPGLWSFPESRETEIDTMEGLDGKACYHFWRHIPTPELVEGGCASGSYAGAWHTYGVCWEPGKLTYYYDGKVMWEYPSTNVKSTPQYLIADFVPSGEQGGPLQVPDEMVVDYVRVWQHTPKVTTEAATEVTGSRARLNATVNPNGTDTHYYFQYGPTTSYGNTIPASPGMDIGSGTGGIYTWNMIENLQPGTTYHFRIVASNSWGTSYGTDQAFTTQAALNTSPSAPLYLSSTGQIFEFYVGANNQMYEWLWTGTSWTNGELAGGGEPVGD
jgi:hypothetical protein